MNSGLERPRCVSEEGSLARGRGLCDSGVAALVTNEDSTRTSPPLSDNRQADKDRSDAHHIIDIQEDLGLNLIGDREEVVERLLAAEVRDRLQKSEWVQNGLQ
ncbi:hypothetical protein P8452_13426 [Trifolium repens]|nr:hypothetical protein P8452_13426 [Trifolium repens]